MPRLEASTNDAITPAQSEVIAEVIAGKRGRSPPRWSRGSATPNSRAGHSARRASRTTPHFIRVCRTRDPGLRQALDVPS